MPSESQGPTEFFSSLGLLTRLDAGRWVVVSIVVCGIVEETKCQSQRVGILCGGAVPPRCICKHLPTAQLAGAFPGKALDQVKNLP